MEWMQQVLNLIFETLLAEVIVVVVGVLFAQFIQGRWEHWRYGNWQVVIQQDGIEILKREISPGKARAILAEPAELTVYLKGVASPFAWIKCDLLTTGKERKLFVEDHEKRCFFLDLDQNPTSQKLEDQNPAEVLH